MPKQEPCHPRMGVVTDCTCYSKEQLVKIGKELNKHGAKLNVKASRNDLWKQIAAWMKAKHGCISDWCWAQMPEINAMKDDVLLHKTFRPRAPDSWSLHIPKPGEHGKYTWLSNIDIDAVFRQYQDVGDLKDWVFFKAIPSDFEATKDPLSRVNIYALLKKGINRFSVIFNLDKHNQSGSHWVALHCNIKNRLIAFFDSYGRIPEPPFQDFIAKLCIQSLLGFDGTSCDPSRAFQFIPLFNDVQQQKKGTECGPYSMSIIRKLMVNGETPEAFHQLCEEIVDDETVNGYRKLMFVDRGK